MSQDFRARQIQTSQVISSGSSGTNAKIVVYDISAQDTATPNQGIIDNTRFNTSSIGTDIFLYVSGGINNRDVGGSNAITVFGGDVHISGNLTVGGTSPTGSGGTGAAFNSGSFISFGITDYATTTNTSSGPQSIGQIVFDPRDFTGPVVFRSVLASTTGSVTASVQLFNVTSGTFVHIGGTGITTLNTTNTTPTIIQSVNLRTATNFSTGSAIYELQSYIGTGSQTAVVGGAEFRVTGAITTAPTRQSLGGYAISTATSSNPEAIGGGYFVPSEHNQMNCVFRAVLSTTTGSNTGFVQLYNVTSGALVEIGGTGVTTLSSNSTTPIMLQSVNLLTATNFNPVTSSVYEVRIYGSGSSPITTLINSELVCT